MGSLRNSMDEWVHEAGAEISRHFETRFVQTPPSPPRMAVDGLGVIEMTLSRRRVYPLIPWVDFEFTPFRDWTPHEGERLFDPGVPVFGDLRVSGDVDFEMFVELSVDGLRRRFEILREIDEIVAADDFGVALFTAFERWTSPAYPWGKSLMNVMDPVSAARKGDVFGRKVELSVWDVGVDAVADGGIDLCVPTTFLRGSAWFRDKPEFLEHVFEGSGVVHSERRGHPRNRPQGKSFI